MTWYPHVTVATVVEQNGQYLLVEEYAGGTEPVLNQPAGHLEQGENLLEAAARETLEETRWTVQIQSLLGVSLYHAETNDITYLRISFSALPLKEQPERQLDEGIIQPCWLTHQELMENSDRLRSPMVLEDIEKHRAGIRYPLELLSQYPLK